MTRPKSAMRSEFGISILVLALLALLIHPYWMPMGIIVIVIGVLATLVFGLGLFVWRESPKDEREYELATHAGRAAYLVGGAIMTVGVVVQTLRHEVDIWLVLALAGMVLTKAATSYKKQ